MNQRSMLLIFVVLALLLSTACGGANKGNQTLKDKILAEEGDEEDLVAHLTGIDDSTPVKIEEEEEQNQLSAPTANNQADEDAIGGTQGAFVGTITVNGETVRGKIKIQTAEATPVVVREDLGTGSEARLEPGHYDFIFTTKKIVGNPEMTLRGVEVPKGRRVRREVKFPVGQITLVTGKRCKKQAIKLREKGATDWIAGKYYTCKPIWLKAGEYEAKMGNKDGTVVSGIQVYDGGIRDVTIRRQ